MGMTIPHDKMWTLSSVLFWHILTGKHYAKQNKPNGERQIPYDLTFNRNLINKTNKQRKYNQRLKLRIGWQWPEGRGEGISGGKGEGFAGTIIKDTWTITGGGGNRRKVGKAGWLGWGGGKRQKTILKQLYNTFARAEPGMKTFSFWLCFSLAVAEAASNS